MFHWICPECGREIAPPVRECPACDPIAATVETALSGEVEAPARAGNKIAEARAAEPSAQAIEEQAISSPPLAAAVETQIPQALPSSDREATELLPQFGAAEAGGDPLDYLANLLDSMEPEPPLSTTKPS